MLSKKMAVSLTSLITIFALAFMVPSAMADPFDIKIMGPTKATYATNTSPVPVDLIVESGQPIADLTLATTSVSVTAFDENDFIIPTPTTAITVLDLPITGDPSYAMKTPKRHKLRITITQQADPLIAKVLVMIAKGIDTTDPTADADVVSKEAVSHTITLAMAQNTDALPKVVSIQRLRPGSQTVVAAFQEAVIDTEITPTINVRIVLTGRPHKDNGEIRHLELGDIEVEHGKADTLVVGTPFTRLYTIPGTPSANQTVRPHPGEGMYAFDATQAALQGTPPGFDTTTFVPAPTGSGNTMYHEYRVTIMPHTKSEDFYMKVKVKNFHDGASPIRNSYVSPGFGESGNLPNGREILTLKIKGNARDLTAGYKVTIPKDWIIPADGYLVIAQNIAGSEIFAGPGPAGAWRTNDPPRATHRTPAQLKYNVIGMPDLPNLATEFLNGVVVDVESQHPDLVISEVMWGEDVSLEPSSNSQYIELYNPGKQYKTKEDDDSTPDVNEALTLIFYRPNEFDAVPAVGADGSLPAGITDRIGTLDTRGVYWSPTPKGQSGRSGTTATGTAVERGDFVPSVEIVSMYRNIVGNVLPDGQMAASWLSSKGPKSANFDPLAIGVRHGTPGAKTESIITDAAVQADAKAKAAAAAAAAAQKAADSKASYPMAGDGRVYISEVMFAGGGTLPQWIEIANGDRAKEFNLSGWTITVDNAVADADVSVGARVTFTIPDGTKIAPSAQNDDPSTILVVTEEGRNNLTGPMASGQVINLAVDNEVELILAGVVTGKYTLLSDMAFLITLAPPAPEATKAPAGETAAAKAARLAAEKKASALRKAAMDMAGNLGADGGAAWALPTNAEGGRSSIIRRHIQVARGPASPKDGMMENNWALAADTGFAQITHIRASSYYGAANDVGTPGFRAGGALPVELSHFRPARDKATGAVVITWSTQSELNNAGFFIKRSQQRDGEFKVINATMVAGAGTTSEKQFYTYTDTTAQPNVVYYYQIEDVSLDGNRQTLTLGTRLRGHIGAAGKATTLWGELKSSNE